MELIATRITEIDLAVLDDGVVPVCDVNGTVWTHFDINRPKSPVRARQHIRELLRDVAAAARREGETVHTIPAEVIQHHRPLPVRRPMRVLNHLHAALLWLAGAQAMHDALRPRRRGKNTAWEDEIDPFSARAVAGKALAPAVELKTPGIDQPLADDFRPPRLRPELPNAATHQATHAIRRLHVRVDVDRLVEIQHPFRTPAEGVQEVVRVLRAEAAEQDRALVRLQIAVFILQKQHFGRIRHVQTAIARSQRRRDVQPIGKGRRFVRLAIAIGVFEHHHLVLRRLARLDVGIRRARNDP